MDGSRRLEVLSRQMCAAGLQSASTLQGLDGLAAVCPVQLENVLLHDNRELRAAVFDFLKVRHIAATDDCIHADGLLIGLSHCCAA
jgi:hypothetical protein